MTGMHRATGRALADYPHLAQSVADIITTPIGSRVMRRTYGSLIPALLDQPLNSATAGRICAAAVSALMKWEPRILVRRIQLQRGDQPASGVLQIEADVRVMSGQRQPIELEVAL